MKQVQKAISVYDFVMYSIFLEKAMDRDRFMSPVEAKEFSIIDQVLEHANGNSAA